MAQLFIWEFRTICKTHLYTLVSNKDIIPRLESKSLRVCSLLPLSKLVTGLLLSSLLKSFKVDSLLFVSKSVKVFSSPTSLYESLSLLKGTRCFKIIQESTLSFSNLIKNFRELQLYSSQHLKSILLSESGNIFDTVRNTILTMDIHLANTCSKSAIM